MTSQLPSKPSLKQLRHQAKDLLKAHREQSASCCEVLRHLQQFKGKPDEDILSARVSLVEVQFALAMEYGYRNWEEMKDTVLALSNPQEAGVRIEGAPKLSWKSNTQCCFVGALSSVLRTTSHPVTERELNGLTALAFRTRWLYYEDKPTWCPSCPVGECHEEYAAVERNTGWKLDTSFDWPIEERKERIVSSIDHGIPVMVYDKQWNPAMAYGYEKGGDKIVVADYSGGDESHDLEKLPPFLSVIVQFTSEPDRELAVADALGMAVRNWHTDHKHNGAGEYWYGKEAFNHWIQDVESAPHEEGNNPFFVNWWNMDVLAEARQQASLWLADIAPLYDRPIEDACQEASRLFNTEHKMLHKACWKDDDFSADPEKWKHPAHAERIAQILTKARDIEGQAMAKIEEAFATRKEANE